MKALRIDAAGYIDYVIRARTSPPPAFILEFSQSPKCVNITPHITLIKALSHKTGAGRRPWKAGMNDLDDISGGGKRAIEDYFSCVLEHDGAGASKVALLHDILHAIDTCYLSYARYVEMRVWSSLPARARSATKRDGRLGNSDRFD